MLAFITSVVCIGLIVGLLINARKEEKRKKEQHAREIREHAEYLKEQKDIEQARKIMEDRDKALTAIKEAEQQIIDPTPHRSVNSLCTVLSTEMYKGFGTTMLLLDHKSKLDTYVYGMGKLKDHVTQYPLNRNYDMIIDFANYVQKSYEELIETTDMCEAKKNDGDFRDYKKLTSDAVEGHADEMLRLEIILKRHASVYGKSPFPKTVTVINAPTYEGTHYVDKDNTFKYN